MSNSITPPRRVNDIAFWMRRWSVIHRVGRWWRRTLWVALTDGFWECMRRLFLNSTRFGPPARTFSVYQALRCGWPKLNGRIVVHDQGSPQVNGDSLMVVSDMEQHLEQPWPVLWSQHSQARLITASLALLMPNKRLCVESAYNERRWRDDTASRYLRLPPPTRLNGNWTSIVSHWCPNDGVPTFSHWILDALPRLALLKEFPPDTGILVSAKLAGYQKESLQMLGLLDRVRYTPERHLTVENYYFSSPTSMISCYSPYSVSWLRSAFLPHADRAYQSPKRFVLRRKGRMRAIRNEAEVHGFFQKLGWSIVDPEPLTFAQKIQLFSSAEAVAGIFGGGFTNCMWCSPHCKVINFVGEDWVDGGVESHTVVNQVDYYWRIFPSDREMMVTVALGEAEKLLRQAGLETG